MVDLAHEVNADLLVVGNLGLSSISRCALGSVPANVARRSKSDVLMTPPSEADARVAGWFHCDAPRTAHGPPSRSHDRTVSARTHKLGITAMAVNTRPEVTSPASRRCATQPKGSHNAPSPARERQEQGSGDGQQGVLGTHADERRHPQPRADSALTGCWGNTEQQHKRDEPDPRQPPQGGRRERERGERAGDERRRVTPQRGQVLDALAMLAIA